MPGAWAVGDKKPDSDPTLARASGDFAALVWGFENGLSEWVVSADPATGRPEWRRVTNAWKHQVDKLAVVEFYAEGDAGEATVETLSGTVEHPFFTEAGQVPMGNLGIGTAILTRAGPRLLVKSVRVEAHPEGVWVYNCTVDGDHTFYVGTANGGAWVHNGSCEGEDALLFVQKEMEQAVGSRELDYKTVASNEAYFEGGVKKIYVASSTKNPSDRGMLVQRAKQLTKQLGIEVKVVTDAQARKIGSTKNPDAYGSGGNTGHAEPTGLWAGLRDGAWGFGRIVASRDFCVQCWLRSVQLGAKPVGRIRGTK